METAAKLQPIPGAATAALVHVAHAAGLALGASVSVMSLGIKSMKSF